MSMNYDSLNHAPGVVVLPVSPSHNQLTPTQVKNTRRLGIEGVLRPIPLCKPVGLGMMSAIRGIESPVLATTHAAPGTVRPGSRRRGHAHAPQNMCFSAKFITKSQERSHEAAVVVKRLRKWHLNILTAAGDTTHMQVNYERFRRMFLAAYPEIKPELDRVEREHERSVCR